MVLNAQMDSNREKYIDMMGLNAQMDSNREKYIDMMGLNGVMDSNRSFYVHGNGNYKVRVILRDRRGGKGF